MRMLEKLARALFIDWRKNLDESGDQTGPRSFELLSKLGHERSTRKACLALETIREPTEEMLNAARDWSIAKYGKAIGNEGAQGCWQVMIDEAMK